MIPVLERVHSRAFLEVIDAVRLLALKAAVRGRHALAMQSQSPDLEAELALCENLRA